MGFKVSARRVGSHECDLMRRMYRGDVEHKTGFPAIMQLETDNAYLHFGGPKERFRPYLVLVGRPVGFEGNFPGNIKSLTYDRDVDREPVEYVYELSRRNLADLTLKGLYESGFVVPDVIRKNMYYLPCNCEIYYTEAAFGDKGKEKKSCLMFVRPEDGGYADEENSLICADDDMSIDGRQLVGSGYEIHKYFEPLLNEQEQAEADAYLQMDDEYVMEDGIAESYEEAIHTEHVEDYLDFEEQTKLDKTAEQEEDKAPDIDPALYESMRSEADALYEDRKRHRELAGSQRPSEKEEFMPDEPDETEELNRESDEFIGDDDIFEGEDADTEAERKRKAVRTNEAENIDTIQEVIASGKDLDPRAAQHVEMGVVEEAREALDAARAGDRSIKNAPEFLTGDEADIAQELEN